MAGIGWKVLSAGVCLFVASGCDTPKPKLSDAAVYEIRSGFPGMTEECIQKIRFGGINAMPERVDRCFKMAPVQQWRGLWRDNFEGSRFCPVPARHCIDDTPGDHIWLTFSDSIRPTQTLPTGRLYEIEFVGRRTLERGHYGHLGVSQHELIVDDLIRKTLVESD